MIRETVAGDLSGEDRLDYAATGNKVVGCEWMTSLYQKIVYESNAMNSVEYRYKAAVDRWVDGDTVDLYVDLGFYHYIKTRFRLYGIDTPERGHELWDDATAFARTTAPEGTDVTIEVYKDPDKYGRWLVNIFVAEQEESVNHALVAAGLAVPYYGGTKAWNEAVHDGLADEYQA